MQLESRYTHTHTHTHTYAYHEVRLRFRGFVWAKLCVLADGKCLRLQVTCNLPNHTCGVNKTRPTKPTPAEITAAVQATISATAAAGNGAVAYFPKGSYPLTETIKVTSYPRP
jgi:hypothetical protein